MTVPVQEVRRRTWEVGVGNLRARHAVDAGMALVEASYRTLGDEMDRLREDAEAAGLLSGVRAVIGDDVAAGMDGVWSVAGCSLKSDHMRLLDVAGVLHRA